jgi:hypothetical protein
MVQNVTKMVELIWSKWALLYHLESEMISSGPGVYQIRWAVNGVPQPISRLNGVDALGCLYIGQTDNLARRLKRFRRGVMQGSEGQNIRNSHTAALTYIVYEFNRKIKPEELEFRYSELLENEIHKWEERLLQEYVRNYLDKPPLNSSVKR